VGYGAITALVALSVLPACSAATPDRGTPLVAGTDAPLILPGRPGDPGRTAGPGETLGRSESRTSAADVAFAESMIPHHRQALEMTGLVTARTATPAVRAAAARIAAAQRPEIAALSAWLRSIGRPPETGGHEDHHDTRTGGAAYGMATLDQLNALRAARGTTFDRTFLRLMIAHHEGAVRMAAEELRTGTDRTMRRMAQDISSGQRTEIARMRALLTPG
jgi:uncharacterized protein (DUF305 family)